MELQKYSLNTRARGLFSLSVWRVIWNEICVTARAVTFFKVKEIKLIVREKEYGVVWRGVAWRDPVAYEGAASVYTKIREAVAGVALEILIARVTQQAACRDTARQIVLQLAWRTVRNLRSREAAIIYKTKPSRTARYPRRSNKRDYKPCSRFPNIVDRAENV